MKRIIRSATYLIIAVLIKSFLIQAAYCNNLASDTQKSDPPLTSYEKRQKYGMWGGHVYNKDEGLWVYKSRFREYFGMPHRWVDDSLEGAEGVALRLARTARMRCHSQENGEEKCVRLWQWQMDMYFTSDTDIGLLGTYLHNSKPLFNSLTVLAEKRPYLRERLDSLFDLKNVRMFLRLPDGKELELSFKPYEYYRGSNGNTFTVSAVIDEETVLSDPSMLREVDFRNDAGEIVHSVTIPVSYWQRAQAYPQGFPGVGRENWAGGREVADFLWIYTKDFAEKFDMPKANISEELEGAQAIAYRMGHLGTTMCGYLGDKGPGGCMENFRGVLEVYLPENAKMYYEDDNHSWQNANGFGSGIFLLSDLDKNDPRVTYYESLKTKLKKSQSVGVRKPYMIARVKKKFLGVLPVPTKQYTGWGGESGQAIAYYRPETLADGFGYYMLSSFLNYDGSDCYLVFTDAGHASYGFDELYDSKFHKVRLPSSYRKKLRAYKEQFEKDHGSLWELIQKHFQN